MYDHDEFGSLFDFAAAATPTPRRVAVSAAEAGQVTADEFGFDDVAWAWGQDLPYNNSPGLVFASPNAPMPEPTTMVPGFDGYLASAEAELREEPEPALPMTTAGEEDEEDDLRRGAALLAYADAAARGQAPVGPNPYAHLTASSDSSDVAVAAQQYLSKAAVRTFSKSEQQQIIDEGAESVRAGNLDRLDITGTHYEAIEARVAALAPDADDMDFTFLGDPNAV